MVGTAKVYMLKLVPKMTTKKSLKFQLADMKANSSILMTLKMAGVTQNKQKSVIFIVAPQV